MTVLDAAKYSAVFGYGEFGDLTFGTGFGIHGSMSTSKKAVGESVSKRSQSMPSSKRKSEAEVE